MIQPCPHPHTNRGPWCYDCLDAMPLAERHQRYVEFEASVQGLPYLGAANESKQAELFVTETRDRTVEAL